MHGNDTEFSDMLNILNEKIDIFEVTAAMTYASPGAHWNPPADLYRIGTLIHNNIEVERINKNEFLYKRIKPTDISGTTGYKVYGS